MVRGEVLLSDAETGEELAVIECSSVTSLRTGAAAAVSAQVLAATGASSVGIIGCGVTAPGRLAVWPPPGTDLASAPTCAPRPPRRSPTSSAGGSATGPRRLAQDVVVTVTPGDEPVILASDLRPGQHIAVLGADAHGKQEVELEAIERCRLFCDEWEQASAGGELANAVEAGSV